MALQYRINRPLLYQEVVNALYQIIDDQEIKPGDQLPSERELASQYRVSRYTIQTVTNQLIDMGLLIARQGSGIFIH